MSFVSLEALEQDPAVAALVVVVVVVGDGLLFFGSDKPFPE